MHKSHHRIALGLATLIVASLIGCTAAPYQKNTAGEGYSETQLEPGIWRVRYIAFGPTNRETLQTYWLERAAELTKEQGYEGFAIDSNVPLSWAPNTVPIPEYKVAAGTMFIPIIVPAASPPPPPLEMEGDIRLLHAPFQTEPRKVFDADKLLAALAPYVKGQKCKGDNICPHYHRYLYEP